MEDFFFGKKEEEEEYTIDWTLELSCDAMKCTIIEDKVLEALRRMEWQNAKMSKLELHCKC